MITEFLIYLTKEDKKAFFTILSSLFEKIDSNTDHKDILDELKGVLELDGDSVSWGIDGYKHFSTSSLRVKRVIFIEIASILHQRDVHSSIIKGIGMDLGLSDHESAILSSWSEDFCEFMETGYMFINSKI